MDGLIWYPNKKEIITWWKDKKYITLNIKNFAFNNIS
jgi:hypothetical protein